MACVQRSDFESYTWIYCVHRYWCTQQKPKANHKLALVYDKIYVLFITLIQIFMTCSWLTTQIIKISQWTLSAIRHRRHYWGMSEKWQKQPWKVTYAPIHQSHYSVKNLKRVPPTEVMTANMPSTSTWVPVAPAARKQLHSHHHHHHHRRVIRANV